MATQRGHQSSSLQPSEKTDIKKRAHTLSHQYGGRHAPGWVDSLQESWIPYVELARLSPPVGMCLVLFPHLFGFLHGILLTKSASALGDLSYLELSRLMGTLLLLVVGSFFLSNAIHGWNDLVDAPYDALVERTRERPVVRGAISGEKALLFTITQAMAGIVVLAFLLPDLTSAFYTVWPSVLMNLYYPFAKRQTSFAQYVLGGCLSWGVVVGTTAVLELDRSRQRNGNEIWQGTAGISTACLTAACVLWTVIYDTIYAFQDRADDLRIGLHSIATLFGNRTKLFLWMNLILLTTLLACIGYLNAGGVLFFVNVVGGSVLSLGIMLAKVDLTNSSSCWWWFKYGFWLVAGSIMVGLLAECL